MTNIELKDGTIEQIGNERDFSDMLDRHLGMEVKKWFDDWFAEYEALKEEMLEIECDRFNCLDDLK